MSSSTVSVTANRPGASLRRPADKKSALDLDGVEPSPVTETKDLKTGPETSAIETKNPKLRKRTAVLKKTTTTRSPWKTALSVILKNLGLLVIILLLAQMIRRLAFNQGGGFDTVLISGSDYERRIAEVEAFLKTTTKMMQVQVEVVDRKLDNEIAGLKTELGKRIDDRFSEVAGRVESMEKSWLSRDEFDRFVRDLKAKKGPVNLDEIRAFAREVVEKEIAKHAADGLGMVDYAVASGGGMVLKHSDAFVGSNRVMSWFSGNVRSDAIKVLQPSFGQPGECFPLKGDAGFVEIKLRTAIVPDAITLEHVSESVAFDRSSAPKDCKVWGWLHNEEETRKEHLLTEFTYDLEKSVAQTFNVRDTKGVDLLIDTIRLQFMSNHGSPTHTCIYRVRVHGHQPNVS